MTTTTTTITPISTTNSGTTKSSIQDINMDSIDSEENQLSNDLILFLSNPSLQTALADGSLDLKSYSATIRQEIDTLEEQCIAIYQQLNNNNQNNNRTNRATTDSGEQQPQNQKDTVITQDLGRDITTCKTVLAQLHEMLKGFDTDVTSLSNELRHWQIESRKLDIQLRQSRASRDVLATFLQHVVVSPALISTIQNGPVNTTTFTTAVAEIQRLFINCTTSSTSLTPNWSHNVIVSETISAGTEIPAILVSLQTTALSRIRTYLLSQITLLRKPQTNIRLIQVHGLLSHGAVLYDFLEQCGDFNNTTTNITGTTTTATTTTTTTNIGTTIANEIFAVYVESMSFTIKQLFRTYSKQLLLLDSTRTAVTRNDVIAIDESVLRDSVASYQASRQQQQQTNRGSNSGGGGLTSPSSQQPRVDPFALGQRAIDCAYGGGALSSLGDGTTTVTHTQPQPIAAHVAILQKEQYPYERIWLSVLQHLLDAVTNEHVFCRQFFKRDAFTPLFAGTLSLLTEQLENYLFSCHDALCLLLLIKVTHSVRSVARRRTITSLDPFLEQAIHLIWPRLKTVMDAHVRSLRQATAVSLGMIPSSSSSSSSSTTTSSGSSILGAFGGGSLSSSSTQQQHSQHQPSINAHYVSRRCGEFCCSLLLILQDSGSTNNSTSSTASATAVGIATTTAVASSSSSSNPPNDGTTTTTKQTTTTTASAISSTTTSNTPPRNPEGRGSGATTTEDGGRSSNSSRSTGFGLMRKAGQAVSSAGRSISSGITDSSETTMTQQQQQSAGGKLLQDVSEMMDAYIQLMERMSEEHTTQKKRTIFLINNLDQVVCIFHERRVGGKECTKLLELLMKYREDFVEEELLTGFSKMIAFVQQTEAHMASSMRGGSSAATRGTMTSAGYDINPSVVEALVMDFASHWKAHIDQINRNVLSYFSNFRNGMEILKHCLTQLLLYYTRFQEIIRKVWNKKPPPFTKDLISTTVILAEIKKYALAI